MTQLTEVPYGLLPANQALARGSDVTLTDQLAQRFADRIRQRLLAPGARLPSVRECARLHGVSPHTVVAAYDVLVAWGLVEAHQQRGFFVRVRTPVAAPVTPDLDRRASPVAAPLTATALIRGMFQPLGASPMPGLGTLPIDWLDVPMLASALRRAASGDAFAQASLRYGEPAGDTRLRAALAVRLDQLGIRAAPAQIVTTLGATQALDVVTRALTRAGDAVLVDDPGWSVEYARLAALDRRVLAVPRGEDGPDLVAMRRLIEAQPADRRPKLYVTVSVLHNPTGASLSLQAAHRVVQLAQEFDFRIVEDDTYAYFASEHLPRLSALDGLERTVYISGFSKMLAPGWRVGFIAASPALTDALIDTKLLGTLTTPPLAEQAVAVCLEQGLMRRHAERVTRQLDAARARVVRLAESHGLRFAAPPRGLFGWVDAGADTDRLAARLLDQQWLIAPGSLFRPQPAPSTLMRLNFASSQDSRFWRAFLHARDSLKRA